MLVLQLGFFAIAAHQRFQPHCNRTLPVFYNCFFAIAVTCCFSATVFFYKSHRDKVVITHMLVLATAFFAIAAHQWLQPHFNLFCNHPYFHQVATTSSKY
jgi:hypothetical protein